MNARDYIRLEYEGLADQESRAGELCPSCKGGDSGERTLSVTKRDGLILFQCHRASCPFEGAVSHGTGSFRRSTEPVHCRGVVGRTIERASVTVAEQTRQSLQSRYCLSTSHFSKWAISWDEDTKRLCLPVFHRNGERAGVVLRALDKRQPKTLTHTEQGAMAWYVNHTAAKRGVIIVEDQLSAIRASDYLTSVALLGTNLNEERVAEIKASGYSPVYLALDRDAFALAVRYAIKYRSELRPQLLRLEKDIKDHNEEELATLFAGIS